MSGNKVQQDNVINQTNHHQTFEDIKQIDNNGNEFWYARSLSKILGCIDFRNFIKVIEKAKEACENSGFEIADHIVEVNEMVLIDSGASRPTDSFSSFPISSLGMHTNLKIIDTRK